MALAGMAAARPPRARRCVCPLVAQPRRTRPSRAQTDHRADACHPSPAAGRRARRQGGRLSAVGAEGDLVTAEPAATAQCAAPAVPADAHPPAQPLRLLGHIASGTITSATETEREAWLAAMDRGLSQAEIDYHREPASRHRSAEGGERAHAGIWPRPVPVMTRPYRIPEEDGPGPASQEQAAEASAQGLARAGRDADFSPPPTPGPPGDDEARRERDAQAAQHAAEEALKRAGVTDRDFAELHRPHEDTQAMTAIQPTPPGGERDA